MTQLEIEAQRTRDYKFLGRFLGIADFAEEHGSLTLIRDALIATLQEYRDGDADDLPPGEMRGEDPARTSAHGRPGWNG